VFFASAVIHMVLQLHKGDFQALPDEPGFRAALLKSKPASGQYMVPYCSDMKQMKSPEMVAKLNEGPCGIVVIRPSGQMAMGPFLGQWFVVCLIISFTCAYLASRLLPAGQSYLVVFRAVGTAAFMAYGYGNFAHSVWGGRPWRVLAIDLFDSLIYGCLTAGVFGWLWPH
jgi:hypothetical protein